MLKTYIRFFFLFLRFINKNLEIIKNENLKLNLIKFNFKSYNTINKRAKGKGKPSTLLLKLLIKELKVRVNPALSY